jgi:hypothetical protein
LYLQLHWLKNDLGQEWWFPVFRYFETNVMAVEANRLAAATGAHFY